MKKLISNTGGMSTYLEIRDIDAPTNMKYIRISTFFDGAKDPNSERTRFDMCLESGEFEKLKAFINDHTA